MKSMSFEVNKGDSGEAYYVIDLHFMDQDTQMFFVQKSREGNGFGGLTHSLEEAGVFTEEEARKICVDDSTCGTAMVPVHKVLNAERITVVRNNEENIKRLGLSAALEEWGRNR